MPTFRTSSSHHASASRLKARPFRILSGLLLSLTGLMAADPPQAPAVPATVAEPGGKPSEAPKPDGANPDDRKNSAIMNRGVRQLLTDVDLTTSQTGALQFLAEAGTEYRSYTDWNGGPIPDGLDDGGWMRYVRFRARWAAIKTPVDSLNIDGEVVYKTFESRKETDYCDLIGRANYVREGSWLDTIANVVVTRRMTKDFDAGVYTELITEAGVVNVYADGTNVDRLTFGVESTWYDAPSSQEGYLLRTYYRHSWLADPKSAATRIDAFVTFGYFYADLLRNSYWTGTPGLGGYYRLGGSNQEAGTWDLSLVATDERRLYDAPAKVGSDPGRRDDLKIVATAIRWFSKSLYVNTYLQFEHYDSTRLTGETYDWTIGARLGYVW